jgi:hypothetical protein
LNYQQAEMQEWEFLSMVAERADCLILLDVNNIYVSAVNHGFDPLTYIAGVPNERVYQIHLAGHSHRQDYIVDTHDAPIVDAVWALYGETIKRLGRVSTMIERDDHMPELTELLQEVEQAKDIMSEIFVVSTYDA